MHFTRRMRRLTGAVLALALTGLCGVHTAAINVQAFPKPPLIYAETAVLMDAQTGQVLYGKQEHKKMYPASLTKTMTCLLAMKNGRYQDTVTVTREGSSAPVAATTHIALTEGEQLTLEQLTYAMMVQSANDAANTIALHLAGSMPMFARMMNEAAAEAGARGTHFVNPSGLPDNDHYTTAWDMAMIARAAMAYPEFTTFAGTQKYELPPTNKNKQPRVLANGNYMFTLNDTYEGAFAGKTGWTDEAGHTLMTIAERDGVTLICVVMKAKGVTDAQFKDTTALFDYGFDNFRRVTLDGDRFPVQQVEYIGEDGELHQGRIHPAGEEMRVLLPTGVSEDDLRIVTVVPDPLREEYLFRMRVEARAPEVAGEVMNPVVGSFPVELRPLDPAVEMAAEQAREPVNWGLLVRLLGITLLAFLMVALLALLLVRKTIRLYYRALLRSRCRQTHLSAEESYYLVSHVIEQEEWDALRTAYRKERHPFGVSRQDLQTLYKARAEAQKAAKRRKTLAAAKQEREAAERLAEQDDQPFVWEKAPPPRGATAQDKPIRTISRPVAGSRSTPGENLPTKRPPF